jgi:hypothetical protein
LSPGSPSQIKRGLGGRAVVMWRSRQLYETFSLPPMNHLALGAFHSSAFFHGVNQSSRFAQPSQNRTGFFAACA